MFLLQLLTIPLEMLYWVVSSKNADLEDIDSSISTSMSDLIMMISAVEESFECYLKNAAAAAEVILDELFVLIVNFSVIVFLSSVDCCYEMVVNLLLVFLYDRIVLLKVELLSCWLRLTVYVCNCIERLFYGLMGECQIMTDFWKICCCLSARWKMLVDILMLPVIPTSPKLPLPCTYCLPFTCFPKLDFVWTKCF